MTISKSEDWRATLIWQLETDMGTDFSWKSASSVLWGGLNPTIRVVIQELGFEVRSLFAFLIDPTIPWMFALSASVAEAKLSKSSVRLRFCPVAVLR